MTTRNPALRRLALSAILLAIPCNTAFAQDVTAVAERIKAAAAAQGTVLEWTGVTGDASSMVLEGVTAKAANMDAAMTLEKVTLSGIVEENGGYRIETTTTSPISMTSEGVTFDMTPIVIKGWNIPADGSADLSLTNLSLWDSAEIAGITVKMADKTVFSMTGVSSTVTRPADGQPMDFTGGIASFSGDLSGVVDPQTKAVVDAFGYQTITGSYKAAGSWNLADGRMNFTENEFTVDNAGKLGFTVDIGGYTLDFVNSMQTLQKKMAAQPQGDENSAAQMEMLGLMQRLSLNGATIRFDDASLTGKILDFIAQQQGQKREDIVNMAKATLPFALAQLQLPDLAAAISPAVNTYLDNPGSIEIKAAPPAPVPFTLIGGAAMGSPNDPAATAKAIWGMLGVTVTANQP